MQRTWKDDPTYLDVEGVIYHYPARYFPFINGFEPFIYYRPSRGAASDEASAYFGYGTLGQPFQDPDDASHRYVPIRQYRRFPSLVPYADSMNAFYESSFSSRTAFTGRSVRRIAPNDFFRILGAADVQGDAFSQLSDTDTAIVGAYSAMRIVSSAPTQPFRSIDRIPPGTGYRPTGNPVNVFESAALQERARGDHQETLRIIHALVRQRGGQTHYNNNVDLLATVRGQRLLIEAKSVNDPAVVVDRMRYGIGQLADYAVRYRSEIGDAARVLAFGRIPPPESAWISTILQESHVAFVALDQGLNTVVPLNELARSTALFEAA